MGRGVLVFVLVMVLEGVRTLPNERQAQELLLLDALGKRSGVGSTEQNSLIDMLGRMIPQSCRFRGVKYECGLSISCVLGGGRPLDLCSGGMIWACCVDREVQTPTHHPDVGVLNNAMGYYPPDPDHPDSNSVDRPPYRPYYHDPGDDRPPPFEDGYQTEPHVQPPNARGNINHRLTSALMLSRGTIL